MAASSGTGSKILVVGGTGYIGRHVVAASARLGHPTFVLVRDSTSPSDSDKAQLLRSFLHSGVTLLQGDLYDHASLLPAVKAVDIVISTLGAFQLADQTKLIAAIKEAGNVKRFLPSEFGLDVDFTQALEPIKSVFAVKSGVRRAVEAAGIPHTYVVSNYFAGYSLPSLGQMLSPEPPAATGKVLIMGDGETKVVFMAEPDIGEYAVRAAADPRAEGKTVYIRPPANTLSHNELVALWEKKTGKTLQREYVAGDAVVQRVAETPVPFSFAVAIGHASFVLGEQVRASFPAGVEATDLFPDVKYTTVDDYLNRLI